MAVALGRLESRTVSGSQDLLAVIRDQHHFSLQHIDEFILVAVPVTLARPGPCSQTQQIDPELRQPGGLAEAPPAAVAARLIERGRVTRAGAFRGGARVYFRHAALSLVADARMPLINLI